MRLAIAIPIAVAASLCSAILALAAATYDGQLPNPAVPGHSVTVNSHGWESGATVSFFWNSASATIATSHASSSGVDTVTFTVPSATATGSYRLFACEGPYSTPTTCTAAIGSSAYQFTAFISVKKPAPPNPLHRRSLRRSRSPRRRHLQHRLPLRLPLRVRARRHHQVPHHHQRRRRPPRLIRRPTIHGPIRKLRSGWV